MASAKPGKTSLAEYNRKRDFRKTSEPKGGRASKKDLIFVVQEHWASHLHYDFRLEAFGTLKSWAVPKGPSVKPGDKRLAVQVEDHPIDYAKFKGTIPEGEYGAGVVKIWDDGTWTPPQNLKEALEEGHLEFELKGKKLSGKWLLTRSGKTSGSKKQWLLIKRNDKKNDQKEKLSLKLVDQSRSPDPMPPEIAPQLATLVDRVPSGERYIHEIKFDGYRTLAKVQGKSVEMLTRSGLDWTDKYTPLDKEVLKLKAKSAIVDGEIVALNEKGHSDFSGLQDALKHKDMTDVYYYLFDLLYLNGKDLRAEPLENRKLYLKKLIHDSKSEKIRFSEHIRGDGDALFANAKAEGLEGIVSKDRTAPYRPGRGATWQKIKTSNRQEFVIGGYTDPQGSRQGFGSLLMGVYEDRKFRYVGGVGTGFNTALLNSLYEKLSRLESKTCPFDVAAPRKTADIHWVKPQLVAEIEFKAWTAEHILRHASFIGLRQDKVAKEVVGEKPLRLEKPKFAGENSFKITHPERLIYTKYGFVKVDGKIKRM